MALIKCPECGKQVSDKAVACPNCGFPIAESLKENKQLEGNGPEEVQSVKKRTSKTSASKKNMEPAKSDSPQKTKSVKKSNSRAVNPKKETDTKSKDLKAIESDTSSAEEIETIIVDYMGKILNDEADDTCNRKSVLALARKPELNQKYGDSKSTVQYTGEVRVVLIYIHAMLEKTKERHSYITFEEVDHIFEAFGRKNKFTKQICTLKHKEYDSDLKKFGLFILNPQKNGSIYYPLWGIGLCDDVEEVSTLYKNDIVNRFKENDNWIKAAEFFLKPYVSVIREQIVNQEVEISPTIWNTRNSYETNSFLLDDKARANEIKINDQIRSRISFCKSKINTLAVSRNESEPNLFYLPYMKGQQSIVLLLDNMFAEIKFTIPCTNNKKKVMAERSSIFYGACSDLDEITTDSRDGAFSFDLTMPPQQSRNASVIGRGVAGQLIGGSAGSVIGVASALEHNQKEKDKGTSYKPVSANVKYKDITIRIDSFIIGHPYDFKIYTGLLEESEQKLPNEFRTALYEAQSLENVEAGELREKYITQMFTAATMSGYRNFLNTLAKDHSAKVLEEMNISISENSSIWDKLEQENSQYETKQQRISVLKEELKKQKKIYDENSSKFFGLGAKTKKDAESRINEINNELDQLRK